jgi:hypothetical protein
LLSRSRINTVNCVARSPRCIRKLRACWATQAPVGLGVAPRRWTRRVGVFDYEQHVQSLE